MILLISGSRSILSKEVIINSIFNSGFVFTKVICGYDPEKKLPKGVDEIVYLWAKSNNMSIDTYPANWNKYGKVAGRLRNKQMVELADCMLAVWDGKSKGTESTIQFWKKKASLIFGDQNYNLKINIL